MNGAVKGIEGVRVYVYDILVFGKGKTMTDAEKDHDMKVNLLMERLSKLNIKLNPDKMNYKCTQVKFLGLKITDRGISTDEEKTKAIHSL